MVLVWSQAASLTDCLLSRRVKFDPKGIDGSPPSIKGIYRLSNPLKFLVQHCEEFDRRRVVLLIDIACHFFCQLHGLNNKPKSYPYLVNIHMYRLLPPLFRDFKNALYSAEDMYVSCAFFYNIVSHRAQYCWVNWAVKDLVKRKCTCSFFSFSCFFLFPLHRKTRELIWTRREPEI